MSFCQMIFFLSFSQFQTGNSQHLQHIENIDNWWVTFSFILYTHPSFRFLLYSYTSKVKVRVRILHSKIQFGTQKCNGRVSVSFLQYIAIYHHSQIVTNLQGQQNCKFIKLQKGIGRFFLMDSTMERLSKVEIYLIYERERERERFQTFFLEKQIWWIFHCHSLISLKFNNTQDLYNSTVLVVCKMKFNPTICVKMK